MTQQPSSDRPAPTDAERARGEVIARAAGALAVIRDALVSDDLDVDALEREIGEMEALGARLSQDARPHGRAIEWDAPGTHYLRSPVSGAGNVVAPPLVYESGTRPGTLIATVTFSRAYEGPPGNVHGGWIAAVFDDVLGRVPSTVGQGGPTGTLTIRFVSPTPLYRPLTLTAEVVSVEGRKAFTSGQLLDGDRVCAEGEGIFIRPRPPLPEAK